jgi:hypothetical protein
MNGRFQKTRLSFHTSGIGALPDQPLSFFRFNGSNDRNWVDFGMFAFSQELPITDCGVIGRI